MYIVQRPIQFKNGNTSVKRSYIAKLVYENIDACFLDNLCRHIYNY